ncbi:MAG: amino acid ABC transporter substrate-binding protein [Alphaproteobacteria bacterium]|nr:amino acid ABC transporter substrate-binding protein [Alphaproteobacteria bacterium]
MKQLLALITVLFALVGAAHAGTLEDVKARGKLLCGVNPGLQGFARQSAEGEWTGFDADFCRAVAAAALGDAAAVEFVPVNAQERFDKLRTKAIDLLARNTTWTMERETKLGLRFAGISYHDGQGFIVKKLLGVTSALHLSGAAICFLSGTTTQANVEDFFREKEMVFTAVMFDRLDELVKAFDEGKCDTYTADMSQLYAVRLRLANPDDSIVLADVISKEPLGPAVRQGDDAWLNIVRWTLFALIDAEELGITAAGAETLASESRKPDVRRLLGVEGSFGTDLGLDPAWALRAIRSVGNYGEVFARNLGSDTPLAIERGINALWNAGGLLYAPPVR